MELLLQIIVDVYKNMEFLKKELQKYQQKEAQQAKRKQFFVNKVDKMFLPKVWSALWISLFDCLEFSYKVSPLLLQMQRAGRSVNIGCHLFAIFQLQLL